MMLFADKRSFFGKKIRFVYLLPCHNNSYPSLQILRTFHAR